MADKNGNKRIFEGIECPQCKNHKHFTVSMQLALVDEDMIPWDAIMTHSETRLRCNTCSRTGFVNHFRLPKEEKVATWPFLVHIASSAGTNETVHIVKIVVQVPSAEIISQTVTNPDVYRDQITKFLPSHVAKLGQVVFIEKVHSVVGPN